MRPGREADPSPPSSAEVKRAFVAYERVKPKEGVIKDMPCIPQLDMEQEYNFYKRHEFTHTHTHTVSIFFFVMKQHYVNSKHDKDIAEENAVCDNYQI